MNGRYLLDTNIVIALFAQDQSIQDHLYRAEEVLIPSIVLGELYYGALKSARVETNQARIDEFASSSVIVGCDWGTARIYGQIKNKLRAKGRPIPENDLWIVAIAQQHQLPLISRDDHFKEVDDLSLRRW